MNYIYTVSGLWHVYIDPLTGKIQGKGRADGYITCEPTTPVSYTTDYLWYYNSLNPMPNIDISECNFGTCTQYRFANSSANSNINAFCQEGYFDDPQNNLQPRKSFVDWSSSTEHYSPTIITNPNTLPSTVNSTDGMATIIILPATGAPVATYTYSGVQVITTNGLVNSSINTTESGNNVSNLSAGIYELAINNSTGCIYTEYAAIGCQAGPIVTATIVQDADCYNNTGNIHLSIDNASSFGGQNPQIDIKGVFNTSGFVTVNNAPIVAGKFEFDIVQNSIISLPLLPGNYAILIRNPSNNKVTGINVRLDYPNCEIERKLLQTAYWAIERSHQLFKGIGIPIGGGTNIDVTLSLGIVSPLDGIPDDGHCQFSHTAKPIGIGLVNDGFIENALFVPLSMGTDETLFKISSGNPNFPMVTLDVLAHEYGHAINAAGMNVVTNNSHGISPEADAINEGFSDITAMIVETTTKPTDWVIGDALAAPLRYINDPIGHAKPSIYNGLYWSTIGGEAQMYANSQVFSYWFYLLTHGGSQTVDGITYTVPDLGMQKAAKITLAAFVSDQFGLNQPQNKNYCGLAQATLRAANALYPPNGNICSAELRAVKKAWQAVGVGSGTPTSNNPPSCLEPAGVTCALCPQNDPDNALCDNHLPYLQSMTAYENSGSGNIQVAHQQWVQSGTDLCFNDIMPTGYADITIGNQLEIVVTASEPLSSLNLDKIALGSVQYNISAGGAPLSLISVTPNADQTIWTFMLEQTGNIYSNLYVTNHNNSYRCYFTGTDLAGNALQTLQNTPNYNSQTNCLPLADLPTKLPDNTWSAQYDGTDTQFMLNFDACPDLIFNYTAGPTPQHANPANSLLIMPSGTQNANSYTLIDNNTGQTIVENFPVITPSDNYYDVWTAAENSPYNAINANYFCTIGLLPDNYTLIVNMSGCQKILADNNPSLDVCSGNDLIINNIQKENSTSHTEYMEVSIEFNFIAPNPTDIYTLSIATGSVSYYWTSITENSSYLDIYLLNSEVTPTINGQSIPTPWAYSVIDGNNCLVSSGLLDNTMILVDINAPDCGQIATPQFTQTSNPPAAACLEQLICVSYTVSCSQSLAVEISRPDAQHTFEQHYIAMPVGGYREQIGTVCFTLNDPQAAGTTQAIDVIASNYASPNCQTTEIYTWLFEIPPLPPTLTFAAQDIIPALKGCDGEVWQEGSVAIMPANYTGTCKPPFMVNGTNNPTQPVLADGMNYYEVTYQGQTQTVEVNIPAADPADTRTDDLSITAQTIPATRYCYGGDHGGPCGCWINECDGQIDVSVTGGSDQYSYQWADCSSGCQPIMTDSPNFDPCCAQRNGLCYGCYRLTVTDTETGCQAARTVNVGVQLPDGRVLYYVCTNGITDDQSTIAEAANIATLDPELQLYPSVFDVLTNIKYEVKEDSYVTIRVYNLQGVPIETLVNDEYKAPGEYTLSNEGNDYSNGLYIFVLETCDKVEGKIGVKY